MNINTYIDHTLLKPTATIADIQQLCNEALSYSFAAVCVPPPATVEAVKLMRTHLPTNVSIKASGGIRTFAFAKELIEAGADRLGCSASVAIVKGEADEGKSY